MIGCQASVKNDAKVMVDSNIFKPEVFVEMFLSLAFPRFGSITSVKECPMSAISPVELTYQKA